MKDYHTRYEYLWRNKWLTANAKTLDDMIVILRAAADELQAMRDAGVWLEDNGSQEDDYAFLYTTDPQVAEKFGFQLEEFEDEEEIDDETWRLN
jgi:hypothetical protein